MADIRILIFLERVGVGALTNVAFFAPMSLRNLSFRFGSSKCDAVHDAVTADGSLKREKNEIVCLQCFTVVLYHTSDFFPQSSFLFCITLGGGFATMGPCATCCK